MRKLNCWEFKKCGREPGGHNKDQGVCPAAVDTNLDGSHDGKNAGRACWVVAGTLCEGEVQGTFAKKYAGCEQCDFYQAVVEEEGFNYKHIFFLLQKEKEEQPA